MIDIIEKEVQGREALFETALELNPGGGIIHVWYANVLAARGRFEEALIAGKKARELDPLSVVANHVEGGITSYSIHYTKLYELF